MPNLQLEAVRIHPKRDLILLRLVRPLFTHSTTWVPGNG